MDPDLRRLTYSAGLATPELAATLEPMLAEISEGSEFPKEVLEKLSPIVLVGLDDELYPHLCGCVYLGTTTLPGMAVLALWWLREGVPPRAGKAALVALDEWMEKRDVTRVVGFARRVPGGFSRTGRFEVERRR